MTLLQPIWLVLAILLAFAWKRWPPPSRWRRGLCLGALALLILGLCRPALLLPRRGGTLVVVADRSDSMPADSAILELEIIDRLEAARGAADRLAVVTFGAAAVVERPPDGDRMSAFAAEVGGGQSNLGEALETALALAPLGAASRLLVISDGRFTGADPLGGGGRAALRGLAVDYRLLERPQTGDVAVERLDVPAEVSPGEGFLINAWVRSPIGQEIEVTLSRLRAVGATSLGDQVLAAGRRRVPAGRSRLTFRDRAGTPGTAAYRLGVSAAGDDPLPGNNVARFLVGIRGPRPLLVVSRDPQSGLAPLLAAGGLDVRGRRPGRLAGTLDELGAFSAVVLENVPAGDLGEVTQRHLAAWVEGAGGGLMVTGGRRSFGPGGYFRSPLDPILPVSMELRQEHRKMSLAMVVALDRSGSMAATVAGGRSKMDLANLATVEVLELLSAMDEFGVVAVDSSPHLVVPLAPVEDKTVTRHSILRIASGGGGIFVYEALHAASEQLLSARAGSKHILLFADAADAEHPAEYVQLLEKCRAAGITVSVVGLGRPGDPDAGLLRDVARRGDGRIFFTESAQELPRLFAQDTFVVSRSAFVEEETHVRFTAALSTLTGRPPSASPPIGGYNLTYLRPQANLAAVTADDYSAPVVASWQVGLGRALAYTAEVDGEDTGPIAGWPRLGDFLTSLARWTAGETAPLGGGMLLTQEVRGGRVVVRLHLDPERPADPFTVMPAATVLRGVPGQPPASEASELRWIDPDVLEAQVQLGGDEVALVTVDVPGAGARTLSPVRLPYSPEFAPAESGRGRLTLERLARATGGRQRLEVGDVWEDFPRRPRIVEVTPWVLIAAVLLVLAEVLERRSALLSLGLRRRRPKAAVEKAAGLRPRRRPRSRERPESEARPIDKPSGERPTEEPAEEPAEKPGVLDALAQARRRASRRQKC